MTTIGWIATELLGVLIVLTAGVYAYYKYVIFEFWRKKGVTQPPPTVPMGNIYPTAVGKLSIGELFENLYAKYKHERYFGVYTFFKPNLVLADPNLVRFVLAKEFASFHDRGGYCNEKDDPLSGHLFFLPGKKWRNLRVRLTPTFTSGKIKQMFETLMESGNKLTKYLDGKAQKKESIEIKDIIARYATDIIMSTAFGVNANAMENPDSEFRYWGKKVFEPRPLLNALVLFLPQLLDTFHVPFTDRGVSKFFIKTFVDMVKERQDHHIVRKDFMNLLIQLMENGYVEADDDKEANSTLGAEVIQNKLTMLEGAAQAYVFFLAGFETSSTTVMFCLYELALNQDIQRKLQAEIDENLKKNGGITYNGINEMSYLTKIISETLRKYPALPVLNRVCTKEVDLADTNLTLSEGTMITVPVLGLHRDPDLYPDPDKFDPERFSEENIAARHPYAYLPFGEGPRICIGMRFGLVQTKMAIVAVLSKFKFREGPKTPNPLVYDAGSIVMSPKGGVQLIIEHR